MTDCLCVIHVKLDEEDRKNGREPLACVGHGGKCPCPVKKEEEKIEEKTDQTL